MKILHVVPSIAPVRGGPSQASLEMVRSLREVGVDAEIVTTNDNDATVLDFPLRQWIDYKGLPIQVFPRLTPPFDPIRRLAPSWHLQTWLMSRIKDYDLIHINTVFTHASVAATIAASQHKIPYIVRPDGVLSSWSLTQNSWKKKLFIKLIGHQLLNRAAAIHCTSKQEQQDIEKLQIAAPTFVLPIGVKIPTPIPNASQQLRQRYGFDSETPLILFFSRIHPKKGLELLISALSQIQDRSFLFLIAGEGSSTYKQSLQQLLEKNNLSDRTRWLGFVEGETKELLLQGSDVFVLPSYSENFGIAVVEAMAARLPVIVSPGVEIAPDIQRARAGIVCDLEPYSLANAIKNLLDNRCKNRDMKLRGYNFVKTNYSWESINLKTIGFYKNITNLKNLTRENQ